MSQVRESALLIPVFNDWKSAKQLLRELEVEQGVVPRDFTVFLIDDASTESMPDDFDFSSSSFDLRIVRLKQNVGHQRAIFEGLRITSRLGFQRVVVMDGDGEDTPSGLSQLLSAFDSQAGHVVVAKRGLRKEGWSFRIFYWAHKVVFRFLVGKRLDFGNFSVLPINFVQGLVSSSDTTTNLPGTILKLGQPLVRVKVDRGTRYFGQSKMNFEKLVAHSFSALAVFSDQIMVRLTIFSMLSTLVGFVGIGIVFTIRLFSETVTPGWATAAIGILVVISIQILSFVGLGTLISLNLNSMKNFYQNQNEETRSLVTDAQLKQAPATFTKKLLR
jgi:polyisoprenyl-phosphate glycosyltransferase